MSDASVAAALDAIAEYGISDGIVAPPSTSDFELYVASARIDAFVAASYPTIDAAFVLASQGDTRARDLFRLCESRVVSAKAALELGELQRAQHELTEADAAMLRLAAYCKAREREQFPEEAAEVEAVEHERVERAIDAAPAVLRPIIRERRRTLAVLQQRFASMPTPELASSTPTTRARERGPRRVRGTALARGGDSGDRPRSSDDDPDRPGVAPARGGAR